MIKRVVIAVICLAYLFTNTLGVYAAVYNYSYDANGNITSDGTQCYEYNDSNQLKNVKTCTDSKLIAEYFYDHNGTRTIKKEYQDGVQIKTVYSPSDQYETVVAGSTTTNTTYYKVNGEQVAKKDSVGAKTFYHNDHLNSTSVATNESSQLTEETSYLPYGQVTNGGLQSKFLFTGKESDANTGLYYYGARFYNSILGRFIQPDSLLPNVYDPQQINRFAYARNNPLKYVDPSGNSVVVAAAVAAMFLATVQPAYAPQSSDNLSTLQQNYNPNVPEAFGLNDVNKAFTTFEDPTATPAETESALLNFLNVFVQNVSTAKGMENALSSFSNKLANGGNNIQINSANKNFKTNRFEGTDVHRGYRIDDILKGVREKEFIFANKYKFDFIDFKKRIIYELKPDNPESIISGTKQLKMYISEVEKLWGGTWKGVLETYH